jgi:hypothetical protein
MIIDLLEKISEAKNLGNYGFECISRDLHNKMSTSKINLLYDNECNLGFRKAYLYQSIDIPKENKLSDYDSRDRFEERTYVTETIPGILEVMHWMKYWG